MNGANNGRTIEATITVGGYDARFDGAAVRARTGVLTESAGFYLHMSGLENLCFFARLHGVADTHRPLNLTLRRLDRPQLFESQIR